MSNRLFIPEIGTRIRLTADWNFTLHDEHRNYALSKLLVDEGVQEKVRWNWNAMSVEKYTVERRPDETPVMIPAGTVLTVDRIYVRKGMSDFSSLTFMLVDSPDKQLKPKKLGGERTGVLRFWAKLEDCNQIQFELVPDETPSKPLPEMLLGVGPHHFNLLKEGQRTEAYLYSRKDQNEVRKRIGCEVSVCEYRMLRTDGRDTIRAKVVKTHGSHVTLEPVKEQKTC